MYEQIGHRPIITEAFMHIGNFVKSKGSNTSIGYIADRPPISYCWTVRWTTGPKRGSSSIVREETLQVLTKAKK